MAFCKKHDLDPLSFQVSNNVLQGNNSLLLKDLTDSPEKPANKF